MNTGAEGGNFIKKTAKAHKKKEPGQNTKSLTPFSAYGDLEWTKGRSCDKIHEAKDRKEHTRMDNVIFIGMPAVGKSTVGVAMLAPDKWEMRYSSLQLVVYLMY